MHRPGPTAATLAAPTSNLDRHNLPGNPSPLAIFGPRGNQGSGGWREASRQKPCPICGATSWCSSTEDGQAAVCRRSDGTTPAGWRIAKPAPQGGHVLLRIDPLWQTDLLHVPQRAQLPKARAGQKLTSQQCLDLLARSRSTTWLTNVSKLAEQLRVSTEVLEQLGVGWRWGDVGRGRDLHDGDWVYPMRDGSGQVIGVHRRLAQPYTKNGKQVGKLGYMKGGPKAFIAELDKLKKKDRSGKRGSTFGVDMRDVETPAPKAPCHLHP